MMRRFFIAWIALAATTLPVGAASRYMVRSAAADGQPTGTRVVSSPVGLGLIPPFTVTRRPDGSYRHSYDVKTRRPVPTVTIFAGPGGDNRRDCLSWVNRCRSLKQAMIRAAAQPNTAIIRVLAQAGIYRASSVDGALIPDDFGSWQGARNLVIEPADASGNPLPPSDGRFSRTSQIISSHNVAMPAYVATSDPRVFVSSYTTQTPDNAMWDEKYNNRFGRPLGLLPVPLAGVASVTNPIAEINAAADTFSKGAFFLDTINKKLWVRLSDNRAPDVQVFVSASGRQLYLAAGSNTNTQLYMRNVDQWGGFFQLNGGWGGTAVWQLNFVDTYSGYVTSGAYLLSTSGSAVWERSVVSDFLIDGFGTGAPSDDPAGVTWYELDTIAEWGGFGQTINDGSANGSTQHRNSVGVSVNTTYAYITNRAVHDIGNARSWRLGMTIGPSTRAAQQASGLVPPFSESAKLAATAVGSGYYDETGAQTTKVWVDGLKVIGPMTYALGAYNNRNGGGPGGAIYYRNVQSPAGVGNTVASPYAGQPQTGTIEGY